jgi:tetratricopeptide (TPR) repeat protein
MRILTGLFGICLFCCIWISCSSSEDPEFTQAIDLYNQNQLREALPLLQKVTAESGAEADAFAYLAETYRRLGDKENALKAALNALQADSCNSFAHMSLAYLYNPTYGEWPSAERDKAWEHIRKGIECAPDDGNIWRAAWSEAIFRQDEETERKSAKMMISTGFLTPSILAYNRWMLRDLPQNAILLTNGDMDTYPSVALQEAEDFRPDVVVMNYSLLNTRWYQRHMQERYGVKFPFSDEELDNLKPYGDNGKITTVASQIMRAVCLAASKGEFHRPVAISVTVSDYGFLDEIEDHVILKGAYNLLTPKSQDRDLDVTAVKSSLANLNIEDFTGPFTSEMDTSPIRRVYTRKITSNFSHLAVMLINEYLVSDRNEEALAMLDWAERMEKAVIKDPEIGAELSDLRKSIVADTR